MFSPPQLISCVAMLFGCLLSLQVACAASFVSFESDQVRPVVLSADGQRLYVTNTPDNRLEIFSVTAAGLQHLHSVPVGMEPVAIAERNATEVWVTNLLSDSVSVVRLFAEAAPRVVRTILVGDEPRDIVFAGGDMQRAYVATAHRGQNSPQTYEPFKNEGRADIWILDPAESGGEPEILTLFGDTPRALAVSPDGRLVYVAIYHSGNQTTALHPVVVAGNMPAPTANFEGIPGPWTGLVVRFDGEDWVDGAGGTWTDSVNLTLPDIDVFAIDAFSPRPNVVNVASHVGTTLFNMAVNPVTGAVYVSNTNARNEVRFEGPGQTGATTVRGHFVESRISILLGGVTVRHLNKHIDYERFPGTPEENAASLATPTAMAVSSDGHALYVAAFGSAKVGVFNTRSLALDTFTPDEDNHIPLSAGGPSGLALDEPRGRLYVLTRFTNAISVVDIQSAAEIATVAMFNPEPQSVTAGRRFLYDARFTSSRGDSSCAGCHIFGDVDHLAWDLGNPDAPVVSNPNPPNVGNQPVLDFHPMKGPMTTQSLRGLRDSGPMHWRGDRTGGNDPQSGDPLDEEAAFKAFNGAFEGLLGREGALTDEDMQAFADFALQITYPPNPIRALDNSLNFSQAAGANIFLNRVGTAPALRCAECHVHNPALGFFGTNGLTGLSMAANSAAQAMKVPHLRNLYTRVGFFSGREPESEVPSGPEIRGFGYRNHGATANLLDFLSGFDVFADGPDGVSERRQVANFLLAFDSNLAPIVGQQVTIYDTSVAGLGRLQLMAERSAEDECALIGHGVINGQPRGFLWLGGDTWQTDSQGEQILQSALIGLAGLPGQAITFTCAPPGTGVRMALDRDENGVLNADDQDGDGVADQSDNCTLVANADQRDSDADGFGNVCDPDLNNDNVVNFIDLGLMKQVFFTADANADLDGDLAVNFTDLGIMKAFFFGTPGPGGLARAMANEAGQ